MPSLRPCDRVLDLLVDDRRLEAKQGRGITDSAMTGNRKCWTRRVTYAREPNRRGEVLLIARTIVDKLASQVGVVEFIQKPGTKDVGVAAQDTLHTNIGDVGKRV